MSDFWSSRLVTFLLWSLVAVSAAFWIFQNWGSSVSDASGGAVKIVMNNQTAPEASLTSQVAMALGSKHAAVLAPAGAMAAMQSRLQLQGVLAVGTKRGAALISVDGKPAKPYRVGSAIEDGLQVTAVGARSAAIGKSGATAFMLELPLRDTSSPLQK